MTLLHTGEVVMRLYETSIISARIRQKENRAPSRPLTAEDVEIVPAHEEHQLVRCLCDRCGAEAAMVNHDGYGSSTHAWLAVIRGHSEKDDACIVEPDVDVCLSCREHTCIPWLNNLTVPRSSPRHSRTSMTRAVIHGTYDQKPASRGGVTL